VTNGSLPEPVLNDICASFQRAVVDVLIAKTFRAAALMQVRHVAIAGGVAANSELRERTAEQCRHAGLSLSTPPLEYCMDNAAMIAYVGELLLETGQASPLDLSADPALSVSEDPGAGPQSGHKVPA
jgi:N6-L-threonylcarbamoyladenine synthase